MDRYSPEIFSDLQKLTAKRFDIIKPLKLNLVQFYAFIVQRRLNKIPEERPKILAIFDMLDIENTENTNPLSVVMRTDAAYLPDGDVTWSVSKYE